MKETLKSRLRERIPMLAVIGLVAIIIILGIIISSRAKQMAENKLKEKASGRPPVNVVVLTMKPPPPSQPDKTPA